MIETVDPSARTPLVSYNVPRADGGVPLRVDAHAGEITTVVGANGAGKSALGGWLDRQAPNITRRLIAHRKLWFPSAGSDLTPAGRQSTVQAMNTWKINSDSRFLDHADSQRTSVVLFDLLAQMNAQNSSMVDQYEAGAQQSEVLATHGPRLRDRLNAILESAGLSITLELTEEQTFNALNARSGSRYPINMMSDGEKSAVLLAADILTAPVAQIQIIDEPERHLHRAISAGLVDALIADRSDCHFIVLTHDLDLAAALASRDGQTFVLHSCSWSGVEPTGWELRDLDAQQSLDEQTRHAILGGRRKLLFVEGARHSLDTRLYEILFPDWSINPFGGCNQVIRAVTGLADSDNHHWVMARGVVDRDARDAEEMAALRTRHISVLSVSEVENMYYMSSVVNAVAETQASHLGQKAEDLKELAKSAGLAILKDESTLDRLCNQAALIALSRKFAGASFDTLNLESKMVELEFASPLAGIRNTVLRQAENNDYDGLLEYLPVRDTAFRNQVAAALNYRTFKDYESAVRVIVKQSISLSDELRRTVGLLE